MIYVKRGVLEPEYLGLYASRFKQFGWLRPPPPLLAGEQGGGGHE